jgi:hypothetical protein
MHLPKAHRVVQRKGKGREESHSLGGEDILNLILREMKNI